ncbi:hypothetical protein NYE37_03945 [Thermoactinomyces sp. FSL K6-2592]|jgi:hypothetical protein|uniref:hypothetical protein n=1 Tax=Thermoactinomyces sp. FSL K6-2592 TaxID=2975347 RepID=UPI0030F9C6BF
MEDKELKEWLARMDERQSIVISQLDKLDGKIERLDLKLEETDDRSREALAIAQDIKDENKAAKRVAWSAFAGVIISILTGGQMK